MKLLDTLKKRATGLKLKATKHSPEILLGVGTVCVIAGTVIACKKTAGLNDILEEHKKRLEVIKNAKTTGKVETDEYGQIDISADYSEAAYRKDLFTTYAKTYTRVSKLYAIPALTMGAGFAMIFASHGILTKRNAALGAAYMSVSEAFKAYRKRVQDELGEDEDRHFAFGTEKIDISSVDENGKEAKTAAENLNREYVMPSSYAKFFDSTCKGWDMDPYYTMTYLKQQQKFCNDLLTARGHLFLNEVYDCLGIERTAVGQFVGWVYNTKNPVGDNYVDFGLYDMSSTATRRFVNGLEDTVLLDFNVDGPIYNLI